MNHLPISPPLRGGRTPANRGAKGKSGFSFAEVMFAVVILGIGFIMVAAIFPVAIQQTQVNGEENIAAQVARQAAAAIAAVPMTYANPIYDKSVPAPAAPATDPRTVQTLLTFPPTVKNYVKGTEANAPDSPAIVVPLVGQRWNFTKTISILPSDPRYAYAGFYKRDNGTTSAELIVIAMAVRNRATYLSSLDEFSPQQQQATPVLSNFTTAPGDYSVYTTTPQPHTVVCPDTAQFASGSASEGYNVQLPTTVVAPTYPVGRTYSLGLLSPNAANTFELMAGDGVSLTAGTSGKWGTTGAVTDTTATLLSGNVNAPATMQPTVAYAQLMVTSDAPQGRIVLSSLPPNPLMPSTAVPANAATGAFVIIADDFPALSNPAMKPAIGGPSDYALQPNIPGSYAVGSMNGRIFRLGAPVPPGPNAALQVNILPGTFNLDPAYGMRPIPPGGAYSPDNIPNPALLAAIPIIDSEYVPLHTSGCAKVYIIGAGKTNPGDTNNPPAYTGAVQDIGAFASYIQVQ
jgi:hypothetical protein